MKVSTQPNETLKLLECFNIEHNRNDLKLIVQNKDIDVFKTLTTGSSVISNNWGKTYITDKQVHSKIMNSFTKMFN